MTAADLSVPGKGAPAGFRAPAARLSRRGPQETLQAYAFLLPTLLGGVMVALSGAYVRRLGGALRLQGLALLIAVAAPYFLGANWVFQTVTFDEVTWMVALYWFLCLVIERRPRFWIYLGLTLGIGLNTAIFSLIDAVLLRMLPVTHPEQLVFLEQSGAQEFKRSSRISYAASCGNESRRSDPQGDRNARFPPRLPQCVESYP